MLVMQNFAYYGLSRGESVLQIKIEHLFLFVKNITRSNFDEKCCESAEIGIQFLMMA
jgi:hypothetical protein